MQKKTLDIALHIKTTDLNTLIWRDSIKYQTCVAKKDTLYKLQWRNEDFTWISKSHQIKKLISSKLITIATT